MNKTGATYSVSFSINEFTDLISDEEWGKLKNIIVKKAEEFLGEKDLKYEDLYEEKGTIEFLVSTY